ncbi:MAG: hypothetical protein ACE5F7_09840 [Nitrospiria bacterium]
MIGRAAKIRENLILAGLYQSEPYNPQAETKETARQNNLWRIAARPFLLNEAEHLFLEKLGHALLSFYEACNQLYLESLNGEAPSWAADYLNRGKPEFVLEYGRMNRFKRDLPRVIRPDLILTDNGMRATELDAVPGGIGQTAALSAAFAAHTPEGAALAGGTEGMVAGFERMIRSLSVKPDPLLVIVISEESESYRPEMRWLAKALRKRGLPAYTAEPKDIAFTEDGLWIDANGEKRRIDILYRFFELFDLKNIPKSELMFYAAKKKRVILTPPPKAQLEEKSLFALFHHPALKTFWLRHLGEETHDFLERVFPKTWLIDPREIPPHAVIPGLNLAGNPVTNFRQLGRAKKKERELVIKPSGFSELAWGSRGVSVGHDLSEEAWRETIDNALASFQTTPYILQVFHKGKKVTVEYADFENNRLVPMQGRVRLSPYYFVEGKEARLGGVLATVCSLEKKLIHGMVDAVMAPCAVTQP